MTLMVSSPEQALSIISNGDRIWMHSMAATPTVFLTPLAERAKQVSGLRVLQLHLEDAEALADPSLFKHLRNHCFFVGKSMRALINHGHADYVPIFLSEIPKLLRSGQQPVDVALIQVSPPDKHGNCSLGVSVEATRAACDVAGKIIAHINPDMPRTLGDSFIPLDRIDVAYHQSKLLPEKTLANVSPVHHQIGQHIAGLIEDGDCLQMGIGAIPDAALTYMNNHQHLGIHTEMFSDGLLPLIESGVVDNSRKKIHAGKIVTGFVLGSQCLYDFVDDNPEVAFLDIAYVNNPNVIRKNKQVVSINSAIQIDMTGQVCADSIGSNIYSGVGGQVDFVMGAQWSERGRSIIAMPSTAANGSVSRIVAALSGGSGVVTTRAHVDHIVTEYGVASLHGRSLKERAKALIDIAHPDYQEQLAQQASESLCLSI